MMIISTLNWHGGFAVDIEIYSISAMCHYPEAATKAIIELSPEHFTGYKRKGFVIAKGLFQMNRSVDMPVFISQCQGQGIDSAKATEMYNYAAGHTSEWGAVYEELKLNSTYREIDKDLSEIHKLRNQNEAPENIAAHTTKAATKWITKSKKRYLSGKEIDETQEEFGEPVLTGVPMYDKQIYKHGGNLKGQMKGVILRQKHGKTRSEVWECAQNLRMGNKLLYVTLEGTKKDITGNFKQVLQDQWTKFRGNLFVVDGIRDLNEIEAAITEAVLVDQVDKVVIDYIQLVRPSERYSGENEMINISTEAIRHLMVKYNFHCSLLSQARKSSAHATVPKDADGNNTMPSGWKHAPRIDDAYGSQALLNAASIIFIGFRPGQYQENKKTTGLSTVAIGPYHNDVSVHSLFFEVALNRYKPEFLHKWWNFIDTDEGLKNPQWS
jgi:hypothetical protein